MVYILDTDHVSLLESGDRNCAQRLNLVGYEQLPLPALPLKSGFKAG